jgi:hypothetical protein
VSPFWRIRLCTPASSRVLAKLRTSVAKLANVVRGVPVREKSAE